MALLSALKESTEKLLNSFHEMLRLLLFDSETRILVVTCWVIPWAIWILYR